MKTKDEIEEVINGLPSACDSSRFPAMSYEAGWEEALLWVLGEDNEIEPPVIY